MTACPEFLLDHLGRAIVGNDLYGWILRIRILIVRILVGVLVRICGGVVVRIFVRVAGGFVVRIVFLLFLDLLALGNGEGTGCHHIDITDVVCAETALWIGTIDGGCEDPGLFIEFPDELDVVIAGSDRKLLEVPFHRHRHQLR